MIEQDKVIDKVKAAMTPRKITLFVVGHSVRFVISTAITSLVRTDEDSKLDKTRIRVGTYVLAGVVSDKAEEWADQRIDDFMEEWATPDSDDDIIEGEIVEPPAE